MEYPRLAVRRITHHIPVVLAPAAAIFILLACASTKPDNRSTCATLDISAIEEIEVKTTGASIETDFMTVRFEGQVVYRTENEDVSPVTHTRVYRQDPKRGEPYPVSIVVHRDGNFSEEVSFLVCRMDDKEWPHWPTFIFTAVGCDDQEITLTADWRPTQIEMSCPRR